MPADSNLTPAETSGVPKDSGPDLHATPRPKRRVRYPGRNPRHFLEKYKELQPSRYASELEKIIASGKTPAGTHRPILVGEILQFLAPVPGARFVDATLGYGGHSAEILARIQPGGQLLGLDVDPIELPKTEARLRALGYGAETFTTHQGNYAGLQTALIQKNWAPVEGVLADLGVSSMQIDDPSRGFSFKADGPLDLRLNPQRGISAAEWLQRVSAEKLARTLEENSDEPESEILARELVSARGTHPWLRTRQLADGLRRILSQTGMTDKIKVDDTIRRCFQAIRIAVNEEFSALETFLRSLPHCVKAGGRVAVLTFHSGEDRRVKHAFKEGLRQGFWSQIAEDIIRPTSEEIRSNPRASSAKLRWAIRAN